MLILSDIAFPTGKCHIRQNLSDIAFVGLFCRFKGNFVSCRFCLINLFVGLFCRFKGDILFYCSCSKPRLLSTSVFVHKFHKTVAGFNISGEIFGCRYIMRCYTKLR